jgi:hypothetical protein
MLVSVPWAQLFGGQHVVNKKLITTGQSDLVVGVGVCCLGYHDRSEWEVMKE